MKTKMIATVLCLTLVLVSTTIGFNIGMYQEKKEALEEETTQPKAQKEVGKLAIVNMDEGIKYDAQVVNYATTLIANMSTKHVVTGLEDARAGLLTGKYSAYVILPTTFSQHVESINKQPQQAPIEYAVSRAISSKERENAIYDVQDVYQTLNSNLSQIYMATILEEFHDTQDAAGTVLENDKKDTTVLADVSGYDLKEFIKLPELKMVENTIKPLDLEAQYAKNTGVLEDIDASYQFSLGETQQKADHIKEKDLVLGEKNTGLNSSLQVVKEEVNQTAVTHYDDTIRTEKEDRLYGQKVSDIEQSVQEQKATNQEVLQTYTDKLNAFNAENEDHAKKYEYIETAYRDVIQALDTGLADARQSVEESDVYANSGTSEEKTIEVWHNQYQYHTVAEMQTIVTDANEKSERLVNQIANQSLDTYYTNQTTQRAEILALLNQLDPALLPTEYLSWGAYLDAMLLAPEQVTVDIGELVSVPVANTIALKIPKEDLPLPSGYLGALTGIGQGDAAITGIRDIVDTAKRGRVERNNELTQQTNAFETKTTAMKQKMQGLDSAHQEMQAQYAALTAGIVEYDPLGTIQQEELSDYRLSLRKNSSETQSIIGEQNSRYEEYISEVTTAASENTTAQAEAIEKGQEASDKKLEEGLAAAKQSRTKSNELNSLLLYDLTLKLPYTRIGGVENRTAYSVMATPVALQDKSVILADSEQVSQAKAATQERAMVQTMSGKEMVMALLMVIAIVLVLAAIFATKKRQLTEEF